MRVQREAIGIFLFIAPLVMTAQTRLNLFAHFGSANIQRFRVDDNIRLTAQYGVDNRVCSALIAPPELDKLAYAPEKDMKSGDVDSVLDRLVPGLTETKDGGALSVSGNLYWAQRYHSVLFSREYRWHDTTKTVSAEIDSTANCLPETADSLEAKYGTPEYEQFSLPPLQVGARYGRSEQANLIELHVWRLIAIDDSSTKPIDPKPVEEFLNDFLPETNWPGKGCSSVVPEAKPSECLEYPRFVMRKIYDEYDNLVDATVKFY